MDLINAIPNRCTASKRNQNVHFVNGYSRSTHMDGQADLPEGGKNG
ncbi:hypothetical protein [Thioclava sp. SK-1]|nr:hypothetical protein [Thioclava sp. SK-1]